MRPLCIRNRLPRGGNYCDFCSEKFITKLYACRNFEWDGVPIFKDGKPVGRLATCDTCSEIISARDWDRLTIRVMAEVRKRHEITFPDLEHLCADLRALYATMDTHLILKKTLTVYQPHFERVTEQENLC